MATFSDKHKFIFIHIEKTGGSSLNSLLMKQDEVENLKQNKYRNTKYYGGDTTCKLFIDWFGQKRWDDYYSFCFTRNPYDRLVSWYFYSKKHRGHPDNWTLYDWLQKFNFGGRRTQIEYLFDHNGENTFKFIGRFENLKEDCEKILTHLNFPVEKLPHIHHNKERKHYSVYYNDDSRKYVEDNFKEEFDLLGYGWENG